MIGASAIGFEPSVFSSNGGLPPIVFERSGNVNTNNWLYSGKVISSKTGVPQFLDNCETVVLAIRCQSSATFDVTFYEHDGNLSGLTTLVTVSMTAQRAKDFYISDFGQINPTKGRDVAARITSGSCQNVKAYMLNRGTFSV